MFGKPMRCESSYPLCLPQQSIVLTGRPCGRCKLPALDRVEPGELVLRREAELARPRHLRMELTF